MGTESVSQDRQSKYMLPPLAPVYVVFDDIAWTATGVATELFLVLHDVQKMLSWFAEGLLIASGFLTRPAAAAVALFSAFAVSFHIRNGFFWTASRAFKYPSLGPGRRALRCQRR